MEVYFWCITCPLWFVHILFLQPDIFFIYWILRYVNMLKYYVLLFTCKCFQLILTLVVFQQPCNTIRISDHTRKDGQGNNSSTCIWIKIQGLRQLQVYMSHSSLPIHLCIYIYIISLKKVFYRLPSIDGDIIPLAFSTGFCFYLVDLGVTQFRNDISM